MSASVELPWPPKELTPNFKRRKHWSVYRAKGNKYRNDCKLATLAAIGCTTKGGRIASITFYPPDNRRRDDDGMIGAFKAGRDGVADALGIDDHKFRPNYHFAEPSKPGKVVIQIFCDD